jgi:hypothetical protein
MRLEIQANVKTLTFAPVTGRRTFYVSIDVGSRALWIMRWDTGRAMHHKPFAFSRDRLMCWSFGTR